MKKRLIIIDKKDINDVEKYIRMTFFIFLGFLAFVSISYSSFYTAKKVSLEQKGDKNMVSMYSEGNFENEVNMSIVEETQNYKDSIALKKIENLQNSLLFIKLNEIVFLYLGIAILLFIFLRKEEITIKEDNNER